MKKKIKSPKIDPYLEGLMSKLLERLVHLEKKIDRIVSQTAGRPSGGAEPSKPVMPQPPRRERTMYEAICAECSKVCEVPFKPSEERPVYCKTCWAKRKGMAPGMPILRPVALPPKPVGKLNVPLQPLPGRAAKKPAKKKPAKKAKKRK